MRRIYTHFKDWPDRDLIEGKDFEAITLEDGERVVAIPLPSSQSQERDQDELWKDIFDTLLNSGDVYRYDYQWAIKQLQSKYTITKR